MHELEGSKRQNTTISQVNLLLLWHGRGGWAAKRPQREMDFCERMEKWRGEGCGSCRPVADEALQKGRLGRYSPAQYDVVLGDPLNP